MLKRLTKRWVLGWLLILNLLVTGFLVNVVLFFAFMPAAMLLQAKDETQMNASLRAIVVALGLVYALVVSPLTLPWIVKWKGLPVWTDWGSKSDVDAPPKTATPAKV